MMLAAVAMIDVATGPDLNLSVAYLVPIGLIATVAPAALTFPIVVAAVAAWLITELSTGPSGIGWVDSWNAVARLATFTLVATLIRALRSSLVKAEAVARIDSLTGLANRRAFEERAQLELERVARYGHPLSVVCIDLDNFKQVNDFAGHAAGDELLRRGSRQLHRGSRRTDTVARIGGDEFAVLLPETTAEAARVVTRQMLELLRQSLAEFGAGGSAGVVTVQSGDVSLALLLRRADRLLYQAKRSEKGGFAHEVVQAGAAGEHDRFARDPLEATDV